MLPIFQASVENVRELKKQRTSIKRLINRSIQRNDHSSFEALTKLYALLYSSFAEVCFQKVVHTPYGFSESQISEILSQRNLEQKWNKCIELAFQLISNFSNQGEIQNKKLILQRNILKYIIGPSQIRNKIAHGQWKVALNTENTNVNSQTTSIINNLDFVTIDIYFVIYEKISQAVEDLIESPRKAHFNFFYVHITELEKLVNETATWTLESKIAILKNKYNSQKQLANN